MSQKHHPGEAEKIDADVKKLHGQGISQAGIARRLNVTRWQVRKSAERQGITWNTDGIAEAIKTASIHARRERVDLMARFVDIAHDELDRAEVADDFVERRNCIETAATAASKVCQLAKIARVDVEDQDQEETAQLLNWVNRELNTLGA